VDVNNAFKKLTGSSPFEAKGRQSMTAPARIIRIKLTRIIRKDVRCPLIAFRAFAIPTSCQHCRCCLSSAVSKMLLLSLHQHKKGIKEGQPDIKIVLKMSHEGRFLLTHQT
jgi:hypothetical protein